MPENLIEAINEMDKFTTNIQIDHFDSDHYTAQEDHIDNIQDDGQDQLMMWITLNMRVTIN